MNYRNAERCRATMSIVRWKDQDCRIIGVSKRKQTADLHLMPGPMSDVQVATNIPLNELRE